MKAIGVLLVAALALSCGGKASDSAEPIAAKEPLVTYVVGHCAGSISPCPPSSFTAEMRANAYTFTAYDDCTVVNSISMGSKMPPFTQSWKLTASGCAWLKGAITPELLAAMDDPARCTASPLGGMAVTIRDAHGNDHHKELVCPCPDPTLAWFRTSFGINCVYSHQ